MKLKIFCRCSLFPSWSGQGLISTPVCNVQRLTNAQYVYYLIVSEKTLTFFDASTHHFQGLLLLYQSAFLIKLNEKVNGKEIPIQPWTGPEGSRSLRLPDFKIINT